MPLDQMDPGTTLARQVTNNGGVLTQNSMEKKMKNHFLNTLLTNYDVRESIVEMNQVNTITRITSTAVKSHHSNA